MVICSLVSGKSSCKTDNINLRICLRVLYISEIYDSTIHRKLIKVMIQNIVIAIITSKIITHTLIWYLVHLYNLKRVSLILFFIQKL